MLNPYEAPKHEIRQLPFGKRLRRALAMARREYSAGLKRAGFTRRDHIHAWLSLMALGFLLLFMTLSVVAIVLFELKVVR